MTYEALIALMAAILASGCVADGTDWTPKHVVDAAIAIADEVEKQQGKGLIPS